MLTFDSTPTENSTNPVTSGGVFAADKALSDAIDAALAQAKESGEFDGKTPARGTDYWTSADIAEIKSYVDEAILGGAW